MKNIKFAVQSSRGFGKTLEVIRTHRLHLGWRGSDAAEFRADAQTGGGLAEE